MTPVPLGALWGRTRSAEGEEPGLRAHCAPCLCPWPSLGTRGPEAPASLGSPESDDGSQLSPKSGPAALQQLAAVLILELSYGLPVGATDSRSLLSHVSRSGEPGPLLCRSHSLRMPFPQSMS